MCSYFRQHKQDSFTVERVHMFEEMLQKRAHERGGAVTAEFPARGMVGIPHSFCK